MKLITKNDNLDTIVKKLDKREYREELTEEEEEILKEKNMFVIFGASDDLLEVRGLINDEYGAYGGGIINIDLYKIRILPNKEDYIYQTGIEGIEFEDILDYYYDNNTIKLEYNPSEKGWEYNLKINDKFKNRIEYRKSEIIEGEEKYGDILIIKILER